MKKTSGCQGCVLASEGEGFMRPSLAIREPYGVALVGEALGADEAEQGKPFVGKAGFKLTRLIEWAGLDRGRFDIWNVVFCRPPFNKLEGTPFEERAVAHCRYHHWGALLDRVRVVVPMGNVPLSAFTGRKGITKLRGYITPGPGDTHLVPTVHPSFIQRGQSKYSAPFIHDLQKAVELADKGLPSTPTDYVVDPSPERARAWAEDYLTELRRHPHTKLAYDIETPGKSEDESEAMDDEGSYFIWRIGFSYRAGEALTVPWEPPYIPTIRALMESDGPKVVWNASFDNPRIQSHGIHVNGLVHDGMVAWHILHSDLPKGLGFVATFTCPYQPAWKHTSRAHPGLYNCQDADVEWQSMEVIERDLRESGLWEVYDRDVLQLAPVLDHMTAEGMPVDERAREEAAQELHERLTGLYKKIENLVPLEARKVEPKDGFARDPEDTTGLVRVDHVGMVRRCDRCGHRSPTKPHFKRFTDRYLASKRAKEKGIKQNPCAGAAVTVREETIQRWARVMPFKVSGPHQLIKYQAVLARPVPTRWDKKSATRRPTMDDKAIQGLMKKYPEDELYPLVLEWRGLDKIAGTYIGRPE